MKKVYLLSFMLLASAVLYAVEKAAIIEFKVLTHDFGNIKEGERPVFLFEFTNTGDAPLVITSVNKSCGCTEPKYSEEPVMPGKTGVIEIGYNSKDRNGFFDKTITVNSNAKNGAIALRITGNVVVPANENK